MKITHFRTVLISLGPFSFPEPTICSVSGGIVGLWYQPCITGCRFHDIQQRMSNSLRCYCACSLLVRGALGMTILTTAEKFEFLLIESWKSCSEPSKTLEICGKPGALKGTNLKSCLSCRSCSEERLSLHFAYGFWICILPE